MFDMLENVRNLKRKLAASAALSAMLAVSLPLAAEADEVDDLNAQADAVSAQIAEKQRQLDDAAVAYEEAVQRKVNAIAERDSAIARKNAIERGIDSTQGKLAQRAEKMYKRGSADALDLVFSSETFDDLLKSFDAMVRMNESDAALIDHDRQLKDEAQVQADVARTKGEEALEEERLAEEIRDAAESDIAELQGIYDGLNDEVARILEQRRQAEIEAQNAAWQAAYEAQMAAQQAAVETGYVYTSDTSYSDYSGGYDGGGYDGGYYEETPSSAYSDYQASESAPSGSNDIVARAYSALGSDYVWGGVGDGGYDCSGLVSYCVSGEHTRIGTTYTFLGYEQVSDPQPGDIVTNSGHCGIYIGNGQMIHASDYGTGVIIGNVQDGMIAVRP